MVVNLLGGLDSKCRPVQSPPVLPSHFQFLRWRSWNAINAVLPWRGTWVPGLRLSHVKNCIPLSPHTPLDPLKDPLLPARPPLRVPPLGGVWVNPPGPLLLAWHVDFCMAVSGNGGPYSIQPRDSRLGTLFVYYSHGDWIRWD